MHDTRTELSAIRYNELLPWLLLFRCFRVSIQPVCLIWAAVGLLAVAFGDAAIDRLPLSGETDRWVSDQQSPWSDSDWEQRLWNDPADSLFSSYALAVQSVPERITRPYRDLMAHVLPLFERDPTWVSIANHSTRFLIRILVWSLVGLAICRTAALRVSRQGVGIRDSFQFAAARWPHAMIAMLLPLAGIAVFAIPSVVIGALSWIPAVGGILSGVLFGFGVLTAFVMALIFIGFVFGWPLMWATIAVEGSDAFDGFSRTFGYVYNRPWHFAWNCLVAMLIGILGGLVFQLFAGLTFSFASWATDLSARAGFVPEGPTVIAGSASNAAAGLSVWQAALVLLISSYVYSIFWCSFTVNYLLLRRVDDGTPVSDVYRPEVTAADDASQFPVVGVADSEQPIIERPGPDWDVTGEDGKAETDSE